MSWKNLKYFAIAVLLIMNVFFGVSVLSQNNKMNHYSGEEIDSVSEILAKSRIYISRNILEEKKAKLSVYTRGFDEEELGRAAEDICGMKPSRGENYFEAVSDGETRRFYDDYTFTFSKDGAVTPENEISAAGTSEIIATEAHESYYNGIVDKFMKISSVNSSSVNRGALRTDAVLYRLFYNKSDGLYVATFVQRFGGMTGTNEFHLVFDGEDVISGSGTFTLLLPKNERRTECTDIVNLLFSEKREADALYGAGEYPIQLVSSVVYEYDVYYDSERLCYYIPVCNLIYSDGTTHSYNLIDGEKR